VWSVLVHQVDGGHWELSEGAVLCHDACVALHDWACGDVQVAKYLVGPPPANKLDGGVVHLSKKEGQGTAGP
jgi:hypothetical protein